MTTAADQRIVVGIDGSPQALDAARWAAAEAGRREASLRLVTAFEPINTLIPTGQPNVGGTGGEILVRHAEKTLQEAVAEVRRAAPAIDMDQKLSIGNPVSVLVNESRHAALLVVGGTGTGRLTALLAGSVAVGVTSHAACPVVVVRGEMHDGRAPVVLGVDGSPVSEAAIAFAFDAAARRHAPLTAVHCWGSPPGDARVAVFWGELRDEARRELAERLAGWSAKYPDVHVDRLISHSNPARQLLELSKHAQLVVVGSRGHGELVGLLLSSVSNHLVHQAACPVVVVRPARP